MSLEIERKFLVDVSMLDSDGRPLYKTESVEALRIAQGYLSSTPLSNVRVRTKGDKGYITVKGKSNASGLSRFEWEKEIPADEALQLLELALTGIIDKTRWIVPNTDGVHTWEVDEFHGDNEGLVVAEVELGAEDETFDKPSWIKEEVTGDKKYYNSMLSQHPYKEW